MIIVFSNIHRSLSLSLSSCAQSNKLFMLVKHGHVCSALPHESQHNDTQHKGPIWDTQHNSTLYRVNVIMLSVAYCILFIVLLNVIMLNVITLNVLLNYFILVQAILLRHYKTYKCKIIYMIGLVFLITVYIHTLFPRFFIKFSTLNVDHNNDLNLKALHKGVRSSAGTASSA